MDIVRVLSENVGADFRSQLSGKEYTSFTQMVTPNMALDMLDYRYASQRQISAGQVEYLAGLMRRGDWQPGSVINFTIDPKGNINLVNGQHTLTAIVESGAAIPLTIILMAVQDEKEVARIYSTLDTGIRLRKPQDAYSAFGVMDITGLGRDQLNKTSPAIRLIYNSFVPGYTSKTSMGQFLKFPPNLTPLIVDWAPYAIKYFECIKKGNEDIVPLMGKASIVAIGMITFRYAPVISGEFWYQVSHDDRLAKNDPRKTLARFILSNPTKTSGTISLKHWDYAHAIERCWRSFVDGQPLAKIFLPRSNDPIVITRTPYDTRISNLGIGYPEGFERQSGTD